MLHLRFSLFCNQFHGRPSLGSSSLFDTLSKNGFGRLSLVVNAFEKKGTSLVLFVLFVLFFFNAPSFTSLPFTSLQRFENLAWKLLIQSNLILFLFPFHFSFPFHFFIFFLFFLSSTALSAVMEDNHQMDVDRPAKMEKDYTAIVDAQLPPIIELAKVCSCSFRSFISFL